MIGPPVTWTRTVTPPAGVAGALVPLAAPPVGAAEDETVPVLHAVPGVTVAVHAEAGYELAGQTVSGAHSSPSGVPGGTAGPVDDGLPLPALSGSGLVGVAPAGRRLPAGPGSSPGRRRRQAHRWSRP